MLSNTSLVLTSCIVLYLPLAAQDSASGHLKSGKEALEQSKLEDALSHFSSAIQLEPKNAEAYFFRGKVQAARSKREEAISDFTEVIRLDARFPRAHLERGLVYSSMKQYEKAVSDFTEAIRINPKDTNAFIIRSITYYDREKYVESLEDAQQAVRVDSKSRAGHDLLAAIYATCPKDKLRDGKKALEHAKRVLEISSGKSGFGDLAAAHAELGQFEEAIKWQKKEIAYVERKYPLLTEMKEEEVKKLKLYQDGKPLRLRTMVDR